MFPEDPNLLLVEPIKIVPCTSVQQNCGGLRVAPDQADGFRVTVSYERFRSIIHECLSRETCPEEEVVKLLGAFAADQITALGYCKSAEVPSNKRYIGGWEGRGERAVYIVCTS